MPRRSKNELEEKQHDTIATRVTHMLAALNRGEKLNPRHLAQEYNVSLRTIQRDINRLSYFDLQKKGGYYFIDPNRLGRISDEQLKEFAKITGLDHLLPTLSGDFFREMFTSITQKAYLVKTAYAENVSNKSSVFKALEEVILQHEKIEITYQQRLYKNLEPYKLVNYKGVWYIIAVINQKLKSFCLTKVDVIRKTGVKFFPDPMIEETILKEDSIWFSDESIHVILSVKSEVASYFKRRKLISNQQIDAELEDGSLVISTNVAHEKQILPIVRYWLPNIKIMSPAYLQEKLELQLKSYLGEEHIEKSLDSLKSNYVDIDNNMASEIIDSLKD